MAPDGTYTTQLQAGLGMVAETLALLRVWEPGMIPSRLAERAVQAGVFSRATARRTRNLATEMFAPRYLAQEGLAAERLKYLVAHQASPEAISQICFLYTARAQRIFADFITDVLWPRYHAGTGTLSRRDAKTFIRRAMDAGRMKPPSGRFNREARLQLSARILQQIQTAGQSKRGHSASPRP